jgi:SAM-dependent methyltransferase
LGKPALSLVNKTSPRLPVDGSPVRLHLGCGLTRHEGWINCDYIDTEYADCVFDAQQRWPFEENSVHEIYASHMLEHLKDHDTFFNEAWRVLHPNGSLMLRFPHGHHRSAWWDVEHVRPWFPECFAFLQPGYGESIRVSGKFAPILRWKLGRTLLLPYINHFVDALEEIHAYLFAIKDPVTAGVYQQRNPGYSVPSRYVMYEHDLRGEPHGANQPGGVKTVVLADL